MEEVEGLEFPARLALQLVQPVDAFNITRTLATNFVL